VLVPFVAGEAYRAWLDAVDKVGGVTLRFEPHHDITALGVAEQFVPATPAPRRS
jgi:hypothetical protein